MYSVNEAAVFLGVHPQTIRRWLYNGTIQGKKYGGVWRFTEKDLLQQNEKQPE
jgi:excisionase family DNA binding protein